MSSPAPRPVVVFAARLQEVFRASGLTPKATARLAHVPLSTLYDVLAGRRFPSAEVMCSLAEVWDEDTLYWEQERLAARLAQPGPRRGRPPGARRSCTGCVELRAEVERLRGLLPQGADAP